MSDLAGRYRLLRVLGEGGMGVVHEAEDRLLGRRVAIKMIRTPGVDEAQREQFTREARAAAAVSHPNACQLYEIGEVDGQPFLAMELLTGRPLTARLVEGPMPSDEAVSGARRDGARRQPCPHRHHPACRRAAPRDLPVDRSAWRSGSLHSSGAELAWPRS